jgi:hypothetical protein
VSFANKKAITTIGLKYTTLMAAPNCHFDILPLCFEHHRKGNKDEPISRHPYKKRFVNAYGTEEELLQQVFVNTVKNNAPF